MVIPVTLYFDQVNWHISVNYFIKKCPMTVYHLYWNNCFHSYCINVFSSINSLQLFYLFVVYIVIIIKKVLTDDRNIISETILFVTTLYLVVSNPGATIFKIL